MILRSLHEAVGNDDRVAHVGKCPDGLGFCLRQVVAGIAVGFCLVLCVLDISRPILVIR